MLRHQQLEQSDRAVYVGWTPEGMAEHATRSNLIATLLIQLANCTR